MREERIKLPLGYAKTQRERVKPCYEKFREDFPNLPSFEEAFFGLDEVGARYPRIGIEDIISLWAMSWLREHHGELLDKAQATINDHEDEMPRTWRSLHKALYDEIFNGKGEEKNGFE